MVVTVTSLTTAVCWRIWTKRSHSWVLERVLAVPETMALVGDRCPLPRLLPRSSRRLQPRHPPSQVCGVLPFAIFSMPQEQAPATLGPCRVSCVYWWLRIVAVVLVRTGGRRVVVVVARTGSASSGVGGADSDGAEEELGGTLSHVVTTSPHRVVGGLGRPPASRSPKDKDAAAAAPGRTRADHMVAGRLADKSFRLVHASDEHAIVQGTLCVPEFGVWVETPFVSVAWSPVGLCGVFEEPHVAQWHTVCCAAVLLCTRQVPDTATATLCPATTRPLRCPHAPQLVAAHPAEYREVASQAHPLLHHPPPPKLPKTLISCASSSCR